ncbi:hypothetical protein M1403_03235 [Patescibacteria group bacterium]|nr:hypothetical protein [Patescibacteria group bacterium]
MAIKNIEHWPGCSHEQMIAAFDKDSEQQLKNVAAVMVDLDEAKIEDISRRVSAAAGGYSRVLARRLGLTPRVSEFDD